MATHRRGGSLWRRPGLLEREKKRRLLLYKTTRLDCNTFLCHSKRFIDSRLSDFSRAYGALGDPKPV